ncbi:Alkaline phosphatase synthesis transcriptional regulatory protein SphR [Acaryochloris thomasi RCC1774]|uniref:Alkaline phosphatase synthesis transcriptional regulatory protein SphR n=1 Tax=Acaryochloris thomasi RCC1774 TaxID=1764569 RepID=A0A2W1JL07_9CYAN|nr:response regulator transcription factor [Acaryochloris thomasi]PZD73876.1 Alkaline phosphatase synthesis transcriptional regulatory protein SphR [Acaryochloris thomasi RCC1774]
MLSTDSALQQLGSISATVDQILLVEDEENIRETIALALRSEGYRVSTAADGRSALEFLQSMQRRGHISETPGLDLIILDIMLPGINGLDLCRFLRREGSAIPVLMLSAKGTEADRVVGLEVGADDYLTKPFGMRELIARCRALLRRNRFNTQGQGAMLQVREICLYTEECRVTVRNQEVNLSPKEFRILELFMSYPRRVWPREQILEKIWGPDFIGDSKTVDVHIRWLREKIEEDPSKPDYLVTVRGFGYRFG